MLHYHKTSPLEFQLFHQAHPEVYAALVKRARLLKSAGYKRVSFRMIFEVTRCELMGIQLNNTWVPMYTRLVMAQETDLAGMFRTYPAKIDTLKQLDAVAEVC